MKGHRAELVDNIKKHLVVINAKSRSAENDFSKFTIECEFRESVSAKEIDLLPWFICKHDEHTKAKFDKPLCTLKLCPFVVNKNERGLNDSI